MKILIAGSSGLVGTALKSYLKTCGHYVTSLVRNRPKNGSDGIYWNPQKNEIDATALENFDAIVNFSGESIAGGRWTEQRKQRILNSRIEASATLANAISRLSNPPKVFLNASAIGIYGESGNQWCNEEASLGNDFLASVCKQWEAATAAAAKKGVRTLLLRFGIILSAKGGALSKMLPPFKLGLGGIFGSGKQYMSWIDIDDVVAIILFALTHPSLKGSVNVVSPKPVTNAEFTHTLGHVLGRWTIFNVPSFALRLLLGKEMAQELLLSSIRVTPHKLIQEGYSFIYPDLKASLKHLIK